jgi:hypothetical protein
VFVDFPLIGSENNFVFPVCVQSHVFNPSEQRSQILLGPREEDKKSVQNKQILEEVVSAQLLEKMVRYCISTGVKDLHLFLDTAMPDILDKEWYK